MPIQLQVGPLPALEVGCTRPDLALRKITTSNYS